MDRIRLILIFFLLCIGGIADARTWDIRRHEGKDHVTIDNIYNFYQFDQRRVTERSFHFRSGNRSLKGQVGSKELFINTVKFLLSYPIVAKNGEILISRMDLSKLIEPVLRPSKIDGAGDFRTIILDPGHGGHDHGAKGRWGVEKRFALDVANRAKAILERQGYRVKMTRTADNFVSLGDRAAFANNYPESIFVSIHFNAGSNREATGIETYVMAPRGVPSFNSPRPKSTDLRKYKGNAHDPENMALATAMHSSMLSRLKMPDRGIKRARFVVIRDVNVPGVLLEGGFVTNASDGKKIASSKFRQNMAFAIADAVRNFKTAVSDTPQFQIVPMSTPSSRNPTITITPN